jgi:hypothetical protein
MLRVISDGLWEELKKLGHKRQKFAAIAYATSDRDLKFGKGDVLVCDASDPAIRSGQTSVAVLRSAVRRGAAVRSSPGLHAKALVLGRVAVVGSANMSEASTSDLVEAAVITDDARAVAGVRVLVQELVDSADRVDDAFLQRAAKLPVRKPMRGGRRRKIVKIHGARAWFISVAPLNEGRYEHESKVVEAERRAAERKTERDDSDAGYIRWAGNSKFRKEARPGDLVIQAWTPTHKSRRGTVYAPAPLLRCKGVGKVTHFFIEEYADADDIAIPFSAFRRLWAELGGSDALTVKSTREIPVELLEAARRLWPAREA